MKPTAKFGEIEYARRQDGKYAVYKFMLDPNITREYAETFKNVDYTPGRWIQVDVIENLPKSE